MTINKNMIIKELRKRNLLLQADIQRLKDVNNAYAKRPTSKPFFKRILFWRK